MNDTDDGARTGNGNGGPRLSRLLEAVLGVGIDLGLAPTLQRLVDTATELTGARHGALGVTDPERGGLAALFTSGLGPAERERIGTPPDGAPGLTGLPDTGPAARDLIGVPLRVGSEDFGTLCLAGPSGGRKTAFTGEDLAVLRVLGSQAAIAIGNSRLYGTARQRERWIEGAAAVTTALLTGVSPLDALATVAERARVLAGAAAGVVLQPTGGGGMEIVVASAPDDPGGLVGTMIEPGSPVLVQLLGGEPVFVEDSATDPRMTTPVRSRFGPSMMLPLQSGGRLIGTLALPRSQGARPYTAVERLLATQFASQAALALVLADAQQDRARLAVYEDRDRIARDLHDLVVQRLFATEMMLESTRRRTADQDPSAGELLGRAIDELDSTIQEVRTAIVALQQPPADAPTGLRGRVLREVSGAADRLGFRPSVRFRGAVDTLVGAGTGRRATVAVREALLAATEHPGVSSLTIEVDATVTLPDGRPGLRVSVTSDGSTTTWESPR
ncbi:GAF domain-containing protein [Streptomyces sp. NPDC000594]|uniref:sensor histidine kinase n=1 Tax=Streptomyces sp. NPDC000594 TaxID=3154261 RepID=UPI00332C8E4A